MRQTRSIQRLTSMAISGRQPIPQEGPRFQLVAQRPGTIFPFVSTRSQPDHFNTSSFLQEGHIHGGRSLTFHKPVKRRITQEAAAITAGLTIILSGPRVAITPTPRDIQPMVEQVTVASLCVPNNRESHQQDRVLKGSLLRLSAAYMWPRTQASKCRPLQLGLTWQGNHPCLTSEYLLGQPLESISSRPVAQDTITDPLEVTRFSS